MSSGAMTIVRDAAAATDDDDDDDDDDKKSQCKINDDRHRQTHQSARAFDSQESSCLITYRSYSACVRLHRSVKPDST